jgi:hypothetical protein
MVSGLRCAIISITGNLGQAGRMKAGKTADEAARMPAFVRVRGAREHNLKDVDIDISRKSNSAVAAAGVVSRCEGVY